MSSPAAPTGSVPAAAAGLLSLQARPGHPDFLDLPWAMPLARWREVSDRIVEMPRGISRHEVLFVQYPHGLYAVKELPEHLGVREYDALRWLEERGLPAVIAAGHARASTPEGLTSLLVTRFLESSLPYRTLFQAPGLERYRVRLLDAVAGLLVRLHLAGFHWGDFSLSNCLFRRDAGELQAYLSTARCRSTSGSSPRRPGATSGWPTRSTTSCGGSRRGRPRSPGRSAREARRA